MRQLLGRAYNFSANFHCHLLPTTGRRVPVKLTITNPSAAALVVLIWTSAVATAILAAILWIHPIQSAADFAERLLVPSAAFCMAYVGYVIAHGERHHARWELGPWLGILVLVGFSIFRVLVFA
jgi:hypothetical protein